MSWQPCDDPDCPQTAGDPVIETMIVPRARDLGDFEVRRALPAAERRMVGPFVFFDHMGPAEFDSGQGIDVRPHPHIGLATVTYLYDGEFQHRDSLGTNQMIYPGEVNWMIAGRGITHSERTSHETRDAGSNLHGIQTWVALPEEAEAMAPAFEHHAETALPLIEDGGNAVRLIIGNAWGERAPTKTFTEMFYADARLDAGSRLPLPDGHEDRGVYIVSGLIDVAGDTFEAGRMLVFRPGDALSLTAGPAGARLILLGGETLNGPRHVWWNFVASSKEKIEEAKEVWADPDRRAKRFPLPPDDDQEFIPLPDNAYAGKSR